MRNINILCLLILFLIIPKTSFSLDLDATNMYENIIKSLKARENGWLIVSSNLVFVKPEYVEEMKEVAFPDVNPRTIVVISYGLFSPNGGYVITEKPIREHIPEEYKKEILKQIKIITFKRLEQEGIKEIVEKERVQKKKKTEVIQQTDEQQKSMKLL